MKFRKLFSSSLFRKLLLRYWLIEGQSETSIWDYQNKGPNWSGHSEWGGRCNPLLWVRLPKLSIDTGSKQWCTVRVYNSGLYNVHAAAPPSSEIQTEQISASAAASIHLSVCNRTPPNSIRNIYPGQAKLPLRTTRLTRNGATPVLCHDQARPSRPSSVARRYRLRLHRPECPRGQPLSWNRSAFSLCSIEIREGNPISRASGEIPGILLFTIPQASPGLQIYKGDDMRAEKNTIRFFLKFYFTLKLWIIFILHWRYRVDRDKVDLLCKVLFIPTPIYTPIHIHKYIFNLQLFLLLLVWIKVAYTHLPILGRPRVWSSQNRIRFFMSPLRTAYLVSEPGTIWHSSAQKSAM